ncbi:MAG: hypothetical protein ACOCV7_06485 [Desulfonatronovibrionaceae bacterium]
MKLSDEKYEALAELYLQAGLGAKIHGLIHNLNNHVHVVDMQLAMLLNKADASGNEPLSFFKDKLQRSAGGAGKIVSALQQNGRCSFFAQKEKVQINVRDYAQWLVEFWNNDLFFKHRVDCRLSCRQESLNLLVSPFHLHLCLDQAIKNAVESFMDHEKVQKHELGVNIHAHARAVKIQVSSQGVLPELDPWQEGISTKAKHLGMGLPLAAHAAGTWGWQISLDQQDDRVVFSMIIPA